LSVRRLVDEHDAVLPQKFEGGSTVVSERTDDLAVVVAIIRKAVGLDQSVRSLNTKSGESSMPYFLCTLVPPPSGMLPPLTRAWPPTCGCASTMITDEPASFATMAAGSPHAPDPITTTSAS
jgi:hypothetical protein